MSYMRLSDVGKSGVCLRNMAYTYFKHAEAASMTGRKLQHAYTVTVMQMRWRAIHCSLCLICIAAWSKLPDVILHSCHLNFLCLFFMLGGAVFCNAYIYIMVRQHMSATAGHIAAMSHTLDFHRQEMAYYNGLFGHRPQYSLNAFFGQRCLQQLHCQLLCLAKRFVFQ